MLENKASFDFSLSQ